MIKLEKTEVMGWEGAIRGMRNPMNSWDKSDSDYRPILCKRCDNCMSYQLEKWEDCDTCEVENAINNAAPGFMVGPNDYDLMMRLAKGGPVHAKYRRQIFVSVDITAPLYWWKEFDTYKVGTTANSCSTMHKIHAKEFTREDFSCEDLTLIHGPDFPLGMCRSIDPLDNTIRFLNEYRRCYNEATDPAWKKRYFKQMIQLLPSSYNQKRTVTMTYENLYNMYHSRKDHKLDEWRVGFCGWIESLPYSEVITGHKDGTPVDSPVSYKYSASINGQLIEGYTTAGEHATDDEIRRAILDTVCEGLSYEKN